MKSLLEETDVFKNISLFIYKTMQVKNGNKQILVNSSGEIEAVLYIPTPKILTFPDPSTSLNPGLGFLG